MKTVRIKLNGTHDLLMNNPQTVDPLNYYSKKKSEITSRRKKSDADHLALRDLEVASKLFWDEDENRVYVPVTWLLAAIAANSFKIAKISKADIRSCVFANENKIPLKYKGSQAVKQLEDIVGNKMYHHTMLLKQGQVRLAKSTPIFRDWSFTTTLDYDDDKLNIADLERILFQVAHYGGLGDFRPTYGRATVEIEEIH